MSREIDFNRIAAVLRRHPQVMAAWVFGSAQSGVVRPGSDLDIAVLFESKPDLDEIADLRADLQEALRFEDLDLVVLNGAHPITRFEAVSGKRIYCRDLERTAGFVSLTAREYEDVMAFLQRGLAMMVTR
ncbi:MAG: nucleotidyltransferase domain-containing protein [Anaerolineae bacterium]|nr:MAG: nucleotidyltransferase domain-containing protein [Anaerolineae bacterium]